MNKCKGAIKQRLSLFENPGSPYKTTFGINRFILLIAYFIYSVFVGTHFFNWPPWEHIFLESDVFSELCAPGVSRCPAQLEAVASILPLVSVLLFSFTLIAGLSLDTVGPKVCSILGNILLVAGWTCLSLSAPTRNTYRIAFGLIGAGSDPAFFGLLNLANFFPGSSSTVIALFGGARSLSNILPFIMRACLSKHFQLREISFVFLACYCLTLLFAIFIIPWHPYQIKSEEMAHDEENALKTTRSSEPISLTKNQGGVSLSSVLSKVKVFWAQIARLIKYCASIRYALITLITIGNLIRLNFYLTTASQQIGKVESFLTIMNILAFLPGPVLGFLSDKISPVFVLGIISITNMLSYMFLIIGSFGTSQASKNVLFHLSVVAIYPLVGFLISQMYCYVAATFPAEDLGKLAGLASCLAGICGLLVTPMYNFSTLIKNFLPMNITQLITGLLGGLCCIILWKLSRKKAETNPKLESSFHPQKKLSEFDSATAIAE